MQYLCAFTDHYLRAYFAGMGTPAYELEHAAAEAGKQAACAQDYWLSLDRYINWSSTAKSTNDFYTDWQCRQMYKDHIEHYVNRRNTYNGRLYKEDPTIFYWDLINEPRW